VWFGNSTCVSSGALPHLEDFDLYFNWGADEDVARIMEGLGSGRCRDLKVLYLMDCGMESKGGQVMARALASIRITTSPRMVSTSRQRCQLYDYGSGD